MRNKRRRLIKLRQKQVRLTLARQTLRRAWYELKLFNDVPGIEAAQDAIMWAYLGR